MSQYYDSDGYYTRDQVKEAIKCAESDPLWGEGSKIAYLNFLDHLKKIQVKMEKYGMEIIQARVVIHYEEWINSMVENYRILPYSFKPKVREFIDLVRSAPYFRDGECCQNCKYFYDTTTYDEMTHGVCKIHTQTNTGEYDPPLKEPLELPANTVCDDFEFEEEVVQNGKT